MLRRGRVGQAALEGRGRHGGSDGRAMQRCRQLGVLGLWAVVQFWVGLGLFWFAPGLVWWCFVWICLLWVLVWFVLLFLGARPVLLGFG